MTMRRTIKNQRDPLTRAWVELHGMIRRVTVGVAGAMRLWQFIGYESGVGDSETFDDVEVFQGIGFSARPRAGAGEAIVSMIGGRGGHPVATAMRDVVTEPTDLDEDETQMHNSATHVRVTKAGVVEVADRVGGAAIPLATKADVDALKAAIDLHTHLYIPGPGPATVASLPPTTPMPSAVGTSKLKSQ